MRTNSGFTWVLFALIGLALAAGVSIAASRLSSERIGLSSEPLTAGKRLVPSPALAPGHRKPHRRKRRRPPASTAPVGPPAQTAPSQSTPQQQAPITPAPQQNPTATKKPTTQPQRGDDHPEHGDD